LSKVLELSDKGHSVSVEALTVAFPHDDRLLIALQGVALEVQRGELRRGHRAAQMLEATRKQRPILFGEQHQGVTPAACHNVDSGNPQPTSARLLDPSHLRRPRRAPPGGLHLLAGEKLARSLGGTRGALVQAAAGAIASWSRRTRLARVLDVLHRPRFGRADR